MLGVGICRACFLFSQAWEAIESAVPSVPIRIRRGADDVARHVVAVFLAHVATSWRVIRAGTDASGSYADRAKHSRACWWVMLVDFWSRWNGRGGHPDDKPRLLEHETLAWSLEEAHSHTASFDAEKALHKKLHINLVPLPFIGNIRSSYVYILYGNPGVATSDYNDDLQNSAHRAACERNLRGSGQGFFPLRTPSDNTGVSDYWWPRMRKMAVRLSESLGISKSEAEDIVIKRVSVIEAVAYHSRSSPGQWADSLPSSAAARHFVQHVLIPKARNQEIAILVWRRVDFWGIPANTNNVLTRNSSNARNSHLLGTEQAFLVDHLARRTRNAQPTFSADVSA